MFFKKRPRFVTRTGDALHPEPSTDPTRSVDAFDAELDPNRHPAALTTSPGGDRPA